MKLATRRAEETVLDLFQQMEEGGIRYAFLRNYEMFPGFGSDIDLVLDSRDVAVWRRIAVSVAQDHGWDALTECDHWGLSTARHHRSEPFCFHHVADNTFLPIDLFHGFPLWGLPIFDEQQLLSGRVRDSSGRFTKIDPVIENLERILQIHALHTKGIAGGKVAAYRSKVLGLSTDAAASLRKLARRLLGPSGPQAIDHLKHDDMTAFARSVGRGKRHFFLRYATRNPAEAGNYVLARALEYRRLYLSRQCGFVLRTYAVDDRSKQTLREALNTIVAARGLRAWAVSNGERPRLGWAEHKVMEQGGLVVEYVDAVSANLTVGSGESIEDVREKIADLLIGRHQASYLKPRGGVSMERGDRIQRAARPLRPGQRR